MGDTQSHLLYESWGKREETWALKNRYKTLSTSKGKIFRPVEKNDDKEKILAWNLLLSAHMQ